MTKTPLYLAVGRRDIAHAQSHFGVTGHTNRHKKICDCHCFSFSVGNKIMHNYFSNHSCAVVCKRAFLVAIVDKA